MRNKNYFLEITFQTTDLISKTGELLINEFTRCNRLPYVNPVEKPQSSQVQQDYTGVETTILSPGHTCKELTL